MISLCSKICYSTLSVLSCLFILITKISERTKLLKIEKGFFSFSLFFKEHFKPLLYCHKYVIQTIEGSLGMKITRDTMT